MVSDPILFTEFLKRPADKLGSVIRHQHPGNAETGDNILPYKSFGISICDVHQWFRLYPLSKIIHRHNKPLAVPRDSGKRSHYIQSPLGERPWTCNRVEAGCWLMNGRSEPLTLITFFHILDSILLHVQPPITLPYGTMCQRSSTDVPPTYPFMDFP